MTFTVLGSSGFVGGRLAATLRAQGRTVFAPERGDRSIFARPLGHVIYCIGVTGDFSARPFDTVRAHVCHLTDVVEKARYDSFVYLSSTRVYARRPTGVEGAELAVSPDDPSDLYNLSKLMGESICLSTGRPEVKAVRLSNVVGAGSRSNNFVSDIVRQALEGRITLRSHPESSKDYIGIDDVVGLLPKIGLGGKRRLYNLASGTRLSHAEWTSALSRLTGCQVDVPPDAPLMAFPPIDISLIRDEFGFSPRRALDYLPDLLAATRPEAAKENTR